MCDNGSGKDRRARQTSPAALAFLGDAVFELMARAHFVRGGGLPADELHRRTVKLVNAGFQARAAAALLPELSENERDILRRGRNQHPDHVPKHADLSDYRHATGLETLFGYLYLCGDKRRLTELFEKILPLSDEPGGLTAGGGGQQAAFAR